MSGKNPKLFRSKTVNTVLVVPTKARKYRKALYVFDFILSGLGLAALLLAAVMITKSDETFFPDWAFMILLAVGILTIVIGALGGRGATVSYHCLEHGRHNFWLILLTFLASILLLVEIISIIWMAIEYGAIKNDDVTTQSEALSTQFEDSLKDKLTSEPDAWWEWQKQFECCGYDNNTIPADLATGKYCSTDPEFSYIACKTRLWNDIGDQGIPLGIFLVFFLFMQFTVCISAMCLSCIIKAQEPIYRE